MHVYSPMPRCCAFVVHNSTTFSFFLCLSVKGTPPTVCAMAGLHEIRELATPLISVSQPAGGTHQQVMSPTLGYGTAGHGTNVTSATPQSSYARTEGGLGFAQDVAAGGASSGGSQSGVANSEGTQWMSTTGGGGESEARLNAPQPSQAPGGSSGLQAFTGMSGAGTQQRRKAKHWQEE